MENLRNLVEVETMVAATFPFFARIVLVDDNEFEFKCFSFYLLAPQLSNPIMAIAPSK